MLLFSVIIPTFNRKKLLVSAVESVLAQRCKDFEVIVIDDGSTDQTSEYLSSLKCRIRVFGQANGGPGSARNLGARHAKGRYLAFLDSDDLWFPWTLEIYREVVHAKSPVFVAGKPYLFTNNFDQEGLVAGAMRIQHFRDYFASGDQWRWWGVSSFVIRRDVFAAVGGFTNDWVNGEDADLALRLGEAPGFVQIKEPVTFAYREHAESAMKDMRRTLAGAWSMIRAEQEGRYPGARERAAERRRILTRHLRPVAIECLQRGLWHEALGLYRSTFVWNASLGRFRYLVGFPLMAIMAMVRGSKMTALK